MLKQLQEHKAAILTAGSALVVVAVNAGLMRSPVALLSAGMLIAHEYGHYFAGHFAGSNVSSPFFVPLGALTIGATRISDPSVAPRRIAAFGAIFGTLAGLAGLLASLVLPIELGILGVIALLGYEIGWGVLGSDGKKYRSAPRG